MTRPRFAIVTLLVLLTLPTAAKAVDKEKLRQAVCLPQVKIIVGYAVSRRGEFSSLAEAAAVPQPSQIAKIEQKLKGDATDAERYSRLARLYFRAGQPAKGKKAYRMAAALWRKQLDQHPDDTAIQLRLADALDAAEKTQEAETLVRRAIKDHPKNWHAWLLLGEILHLNCYRTLTGGRPFHTTEAFLQSMRVAQPTPEAFAAARQHHQEAVDCFDRAVRLAPEESEVYQRRGASRYDYGFYDYGLRLYKGEKADFSECYLGRDAIPDLRRAVELNRQEYKGIGMVAFMEGMTEVRDYDPRNGSAEQTKKQADALSEPTRKRLREDMARLEKGIQNPDKHKAAEAAEVLAYLQMLILFEDTTAAEKSARRSIELDPTREVAWDILLGCLLQAEAYKDLAVVCQQRLKGNDCPRNRLLLAKAYEYLDQLDKAEEVVRAGLKREAQDFMLRFALADLLLMRGDEESISAARQILDKLRQEKISEGGPEDRWVNYTFANGIYFGLVGATKNAHECLKAVQKRRPQYPGIDDALKALDE